MAHKARENVCIVQAWTMHNYMVGVTAPVHGLNVFVATFADLTMARVVSLNSEDA